MHELLLAYPELSVNIDLLNDRERQGDEGYDLAVRLGPLEDSGWFVESLARVRLGLFANPALLKQHGEPQSPADLQQYPCIATNCAHFRESGEFALWRLRREREVREVRVRARVALTDPNLHLQLALKGVGVAMLVRNEAAEGLKQRKLVRILKEWEPEPLQLYALHPSRLAASPKVRAFIEFVKRNLAKQQ